MAEESAEVRVKLVVDDQSSATIERMREGMKGVDENTKKTDQGFKDLGEKITMAGEGIGVLAIGAAAAAAAIGIAYEATLKLAEASTEAADEGYKQVRTMTGLGAMMDRGAHSMKDIRAYSEGLHEDLEMAGVKAGVANKEMISMYDSLIQRGNIGTEKAKELTEQFAQIGKILPGGSHALVQGFNQMEMGMVRARNPMVQLIAATHILQGNAQAVAKQMQHMTPAHQMELAEKALTKQADILKNGGNVLPPTLDELKTSFTGMREMMLESIGTPITEHLVPALDRARTFLQSHMETIEDWGSKVGNVLGEWVDKAEAMVSGETFNQIFGEWMDAWNNSKETNDQIKKDWEDMTKNLLDAFKEAMKWAKAIGEVFNDIADVITGGNANRDIAEKAMNQKAVEVSTTGKGDTAAFQEAAARYKQQASGSMSDEDINKVIEKQKALFDANEKMAEQARQAAQGMDIDKLSHFAENMAGNATQPVRDATTHFMAETINNSKDLQQALIAGAFHVSMGMDEFIKMLSADSPELGRKLKELQNPLKEAGGLKAPQMTFTGDFHIHQDFRDVDPDRVAVVFRKDLLKHAQARTQARTATPFGM
jgi:hypothetical protein